MSRESTATWRLFRKYYVYIHQTKDTGEVFYVGKGSSNRGWKKGKRNIVWRNISRKHGFDVHIIWDGDSEACAFSIERVTIAKYRSMGLARANISDGGTGVSGFKRTFEDRLGLSRAKGGRPVYCSNGMMFGSCSMAGEYFGINAGNIGKCAEGVITSSGGYSWSYDKVPELNITLYKTPSPRRKCVYSSEFEYFESINDAVKYLESIGIKSDRSGIRASANSEYRTAYGRRWSFSGYPEKPEFTGNSAKGKWQSCPERNAAAIKKRKENKCK